MRQVARNRENEKTDALSTELHRHRRHYTTQEQRAYNAWGLGLTQMGHGREAGVASLALTSQLRAFTRASEQLLELLLI
jgi:hypothetical protein